MIWMTQPARLAIAVLASSALTTSLRAGVTVAEHAEGARWPLGAAAVDVAGGRAPAEFTAGVLLRGGERMAQTFTVREACTLSHIHVAYSSGNDGGTIQLRLQEVDVALSDDPAAYVYAQRENLFATSDLAFEYPGGRQDIGVLSLSFTGDDRVRLEAGKTYAIEFIDPGTSPRGFTLRRRGSSTYPAGAIFVNGISLNGVNTRSLGMRIFTAEQPGSDTPDAAPAVPAAAAPPTVAVTPAAGTGPNVYPDFAPQASGQPAAPKGKAPAPVPMPDGKGLLVKLDDFANDPAEWKFFNGQEFPGATGSLTVVGDAPGVEGGALKLVGDFTGGGAYVAVTKALAMPGGHDLACIRLRYKTANVQNVTVRFGDGGGQIHQRKNVALVADGQWHDLALHVSDIVGGEHWGGANNGKWNGPAKLLSINIGVTSHPEQKQLELLMADIRAEAVDAVTAEGHDTVKAGVTVLAASPSHSVSTADYGFKLTYRWQSQPTQRDYKVFMHIVDGEGKTVYDDDHFPPTPTSKWNGLVEYTRDVCLPRWVPKGKQTLDALPEGEYKLYAGLYNNLGRKPVLASQGATPDEEHRVLIGTLTIDNNTPIPPLGEPTLDLTGYKLTFNDEFDEDIKVSAWGPITEGGAKWIAHTPYKGDFGDAKFSDPVEGFPFTVDNGVLRIECRHDGTRWRSGLISSLDTEGNGFSQQYGYFEMRAKFPATPGTWPGFWLTGVRRVTHPDDKESLNIEIDIVEQYGHWPNKLSTALHIWDRSGKGRGSHLGVRHLVPGMTEDFHTYGAMVTPEHIIYYYDGVELRREPTPECGHAPLYVLAELAGGPGWPMDRTPNPTYMHIDYIRVYAKE